MKKDTYVRITKVAEKNPNSNGVTVKYWVEGILIRDITVGDHIKMWRMRNINYPTGRAGVFNTSVVISIEGNLVETENSTYRITKRSIPEKLKEGHG